MKTSNSASTTPATANRESRLQHFEDYGSARVNSNRWFAAFLLTMFSLVLSLCSIAYMTPLKTIEPYIVKVDSSSGAVDTTSLRAEKYEPGQAEKKYFLSQWASKLLALDSTQLKNVQRTITEDNLITAYEQLVDKATSEMSTWIDTEKPIARIATDPTLTRYAQIKSVTFPSNEIGLIRVRTEERSLRQQAPVYKHLLITVHLKTIPPKDERDIYKNPIGLFISHFSIVEDIQ